ARQLNAIRDALATFSARQNAISQKRQATANSAQRRVMLWVGLGAGIVLILLVGLIADAIRAVSRPLGRVASGARQIAAGDLSVRIRERAGGGEGAELS